jgi:hypothetical protein
MTLTASNAFLPIILAFSSQVNSLPCLASSWMSVAVGRRLDFGWSLVGQGSAR